LALKVKGEFASKFGSWAAQVWGTSSSRPSAVLVEGHFLRSLAHSLRSLPCLRLPMTHHRVEIRITALIEVTGMRVSIPASLLIAR
jgi:hypothetical protein